MHAKRMLGQANIVKKRKFTVKKAASAAGEVVDNTATARQVEEHCLTIDDVVDGNLLNRLCRVKTVRGLTEEQNSLLESARSQTTGYLGRKENARSVFFETLGFDKELRRLRKIVDCAPPGAANPHMLEVFFHLLSGPKTHEKKTVLNKCLVFYAFKALKTIDGKSYEPGTCLTNLKMLFAIFKVSKLNKYV